jgi:radical SAM protein (TIGR01212 family)
MLASKEPVYTLGRHLKAKYGRPLRRVMLDLGLTCPNRDGVLGRGGCIYCDVSGSGTGAMKKRQPLEEQWQEGLKRARKINPEGPAAIAYFQSYSSTYPDLAPLADGIKKISQWASEAPILAIGTRPDCFSPEAAALLAKYQGTFAEVWVEFGLETADDEVQKRIERFDTLENFFTAADIAHSYGLGVICHCIEGLPGEKEDGLQKQVAAAIQAKVEGIKFHQLMVLKKTKLAKQWMAGEIQLPTPDTYRAKVVAAIEHLPPNMVVHRLVAEAPKEEYLAPLGWPSRLQMHASIENALKKKGSYQGIFFSGE